VIRSTHTGELNLGGSSPIPCYVLEDGQRVVVASGIQGLLGASKNGHLSRQLARLSNESDRLTLRPVPFISPGGPATGYAAEDIVKILRAYQRAFLNGTLHSQQRPIAMAAMSAIEAFAEVGLRALIDDATGFTKERASDDLTTYFQRVFAERMRAWSVCFDSEWDRLLCKLYGYDYEGRPPRFAAGINHMVYRITFGEEVASELGIRNPSPSHRSNHQHLTDEGRNALSNTISTVKGLIRVSRGPQDFMAKVGVVFKNAPLQLELS